MFGIYNGKNLYLPSPFSEWILDKKDFFRDDPANATNQGVLDSITKFKSLFQIIQRMLHYVPYLAPKSVFQHLR